MFTEHLNAQDAVCGDKGVTIDIVRPGELRVSDAGSRLWYRYGTDSINTGVVIPTGPGEITHWKSRGAAAAWPDTTVSSTTRKTFKNLRDLGDSGDRALFVTSGPAPGDMGTVIGVDTATGVTGLPALPALPARDFTHFVNDARFFAGDAGVITSEQENVHEVPGVKYGVYAYEPVATGAATTPTTPTRAAGETTDAASLTADVTWASCNGSAAPVGAATQYAAISSPRR